MAENNKQKRDDRYVNKNVGSGVGVAPGDTISSALDPFGGAAAAVGEPADNNEKRGAAEDNDRSK
ncbi:hypothetical protein [Virgibacillus sediminis]|uniref:Uncharacterized protein n=1 Tax=Virgibacillus sediminis TaxID=202260 RepID=A0ABV7A1Z2_9BACI